MASTAPLVETQQGDEQKYGEGLRKLLEPLLLRAEVDVVFSGHYHSFQVRFYGRELCAV